MANFHIVMEARDPARNQARSYVIEAGYDLFDDFVVTTSFGRIGSKGQIRRLAFTSQEAAIPTLRKILKQRLM
jgi:predicted DNA-binding WGR domain protein